jgi:hypothetical protein
MKKKLQILYIFFNTQPYSLFVNEKSLFFCPVFNICILLILPMGNGFVVRVKSSVSKTRNFTLSEYIYIILSYSILIERFRLKQKKSVPPV